MARSFQPLKSVLAYITPPISINNNLYAYNVDVAGLGNEAICKSFTKIKHFAKNDPLSQQRLNIGYRFKKNRLSRLTLNQFKVKLRLVY